MPPLPLASRPTGLRSAARPRPARTAVAAAVLALAVACSAPSDPLPDRQDRLAEALRGVDGVAEVTPGPVDPAPTASARDTRGLDLDARTDAVATAEVAATAADVVAVLSDDGAPLRSTVRLWRDAGAAGRPSLSIALTRSSDTREALRSTLALADLPGVTDLFVQPDNVGVTVDGAAALPAVARSAAEADVPLTQLTTPGQRITTFAPPGSLDPALVGLMTEVDGWTGVTSLRVGDHGEADGSVWLEVQVQGDDTVGEVTAALEASATLRGRDRPVQFTVSSSFRETGGVVGVPAAPAAAEPAAATGTTWPDDPAAPACAGADLQVTAGEPDAAAGRRFLLLTATNASGRPCAVAAAPAVTFVRASGTPAPDVEVGTPTGTPEPARQAVPAGGTVHALLTWHAMSTSQDPDVTVALTVTPAPGTTPVTVPVADPLDVLAGAAVEVQPWQRTVDGWSAG